MKTQKLNFESFASEELSRKQKTTILGKAGTTTLPEIDENGNIVNTGSGTGDGTGEGATGPGEGANTTGGSGKNP